ILCQGCGSCAAVCPNSATVLRGYHDGPVMALIDAALEEPFGRFDPLNVLEPLTMKERES
ncbi:MAG: 4Fe-4S binding protein, partial [Desulfovibrionaceae bacterium]